MKHDEKIWGKPRNVEVSFAAGWGNGCKTSFASLAECESYLKEQIGPETFIDLPDGEADDAASADVITDLCGNSKICATVIL